MTGPESCLKEMFQIKKQFAVLTLAALLLSFAACGDILSQPTAPEVYVPSDAMEVVVSYMDGRAKVITRKTTQKELTELSLACVYFDAAGNRLGELAVMEGAVEVEEAVSSWSFDAPLGSAYVEAAVAGVTYADGAKEVCPGVDTWATETVAAFQAESRAAKLKKQADQAKACPAVTIKTEFTKDEGLVVQVSNISQKEIENVLVYTLWYDEAGLPVDVGGAFARNATRNSLAELELGEDATFTIPTEAGAAQARQVVEKVIFTDGEIWENAYVCHWLAANLESAE